MKINKQTNKNTQLQNKIKLKKKKTKQTEFFLCPTLVTRPKKHLSFFLPSPKLTIILYTF